MFFLKQLGDARNIRNRLLECFERAASPFISEAERSRLLSFVVVGGGPTSIEYACTQKRLLRADKAVSIHLFGLEVGNRCVCFFESTHNNMMAQESILVRKTDSHIFPAPVGETSTCV